MESSGYNEFLANTLRLLYDVGKEALLASQSEDCSNQERVKLLEIASVSTNALLQNVESLPPEVLNNVKSLRPFEP